MNFLHLESTERLLVSFHLFLVAAARLIAVSAITLVLVLMELVARSFRCAVLGVEAVSFSSVVVVALGLASWVDVVVTVTARSVSGVRVATLVGALRGDVWVGIVVVWFRHSDLQQTV